MGIRDDFCKVQPRFFKTDPVFGSLPPEMRLIYLAVWVHAFDARTETLVMDENFYLTLKIMTGLPETSLKRVFKNSCDKFATLLRQDGNRLIVNGLHKIHRGIRIKNTIVQQYRYSFATTEENRIEENRIEENRIDCTARCSVPEPAPQDIPEDLKNLELYRTDQKLIDAWPNLKLALEKACPGISIASELAKAHAWEVANPERRKKNRARFLTAWCYRQQDRHGPPLNRKSIIEKAREIDKGASNGNT